MSGRRIDQWLWFARLAKTRSLAARLCAQGAISVNAGVVEKPSQELRVGDVVALPQGRWRRSVRVLALGMRRGPAPEATLLYEETAPPVPLAAEAEPWLPLLEDGPAA